MPIYEFQCHACGHRFDRLQKLSEPDPTQCPDCSQPQVRRQISAPQFRLAGGGWYETDFKKEGDKKHNLAGDAGIATPSKEAPSKEAPSKDKSASPAPAPAATPAA